MLKHAITFLTILCVFTNQCCAIESPQGQNTADSVVMFEFGGVPFEMDSMAIALVEALEANPKARQFRTDWTYSIGGGSGDGAVLYDRKLKVLKYFERDYDGQGMTTFRYQFDKVSDTSLYKLRADLISPPKNQKNKLDIKIAFDGLLRYDCHRTGGWRYRKWNDQSPAKKKQPK